MAGIKVGAKSQELRQSKSGPKRVATARCKSLELKPITQSEMACMFSKFDDESLKRIVLQLLKVLSKRMQGESRSGLIIDVIHAVDPWVEFDGVMFVPAKRVSKKRTRKAA